MGKTATRGRFTPHHFRTSEMTDRVIVFGAGASASFGVPTTDRFIDVAEDLRVRGSLIKTDAAFDRFFEILQQRFTSLHAKSTINLENIETVFGLTEMARLVRRLPGFEIDQIEALGGAVRTVLVETVMLSGLFEYRPDRGWSAPKHYLRIAESLAKRMDVNRQCDTALITFNYDLGLDFALSSLDLGPDYGFGQNRGGRSGVKLLKLHGSLNWVTCRKCNMVRAIPIGDVTQAYAGIRVRSGGPVQLPLDPRRAHKAIGPHCEGDAAPLEVTLVPPSWNKTQYWEQLVEVWSAAAHALSTARHLTFVGYSVPETDSFFRDLLALGLEGPTRVRSFDVVNPDERAAARIRGLLGPDVESRFRHLPMTFEDWLDNEFDKKPNFYVV